MANSIIKVEGISKRYILSHEAVRRDDVHQYQRFSDVLVSASKTPFRYMRKRIEPNPTYEELWALKDVSFTVQQGDVIGIIGRNGAGKSTLLKILSRITEPTSGRIEIGGRIASLLEVGTGFHSELTGRENIYLNGAILGMSRNEIKRKFDEIVSFAEVDKFLDTPVKHYSSGMYVRLAFAVAAHLEPEILIIDEVLAVGDAQFQKKCLGKMQNVSRNEGRTVLFVSHNMAAVSALCSSAILMEKGSISQSGDVSCVAAKYAASFQERNVADLSSRLDRSGEGQVRFTKIWTEDNYGNKLEEVSSGDRVVVAAEYHSQEQKVLRNTRASFCIMDSAGQILFLASTELTAPEANHLPPNGVIRCIFLRLPLSGGEYPITAFLEVNGITQDLVDNAGCLRVGDGNFYGSGKLYPNGWQGKGVLVEHAWILPS